MLFGKLIFIKKTGGDGSRFPVTERIITIGRSEECLIRIHKPQVAQQHCHLIVDDTGQVKLKNFSNHTFLNSKPLNVGEYVLHHCDVFKIGGRLVRWEYAPTSKYHQQVLASPNKLVVVIMPQHRSQESLVPLDSSVSLSSPKLSLGIKRKYTEKLFSENENKLAVLSASNLNKLHCAGAMSMPLTQSTFNIHSAKKFNPKIKDKKTMSEVCKEELTPPDTLSLEKLERSVSSRKTKMTTPTNNLKSNKRKSCPVKKICSVLSSDISSISRRERALFEAPDSSVLQEPASKRRCSAKRHSLKLISTFASDKKMIAVTPEKRTVPPRKLVGSENKLKAGLISAPKTVKVSRLSLGTKTKVDAPRISLLKSYSRKLILSPFNKLDGKNDFITEELSVNKNTSACLNESRQSTLKNTSKISRKSISSSTISHIESLNKSGGLGVSSTPKSTNFKRVSTSASKIISSERALAGNLGNSKFKMNNVSTPRRSKISQTKRSSLQSSKKKPINSKTKSSLSMPDVLAKRAAQKLKAISPRKPDKNKKAALLVLGKAIRKQSVNEKVETILKKKLVKKAIKQSIGAPVTKKSKSDKLLKEKKTKREKLEPKIPKKKFHTLFTARDKSSSAKKVELGKKISKIDKTCKKIGVPISSELSFDASKIKSSLDKSPTSSCSNRRSKRLSSKSNVSRPEFMELSPTALGLIPKTDEYFKLPLSKSRRSISLTTPKAQNSGIKMVKKSASTNKKIKRRDPKFLSMYLCEPTDFSTPFKFEDVHTPNITLDTFVSPLTGSDSFNNIQSDLLVESKNFTGSTKIKEILASPRNDRKMTKCPRKLLQSPSLEQILYPDKTLQEDFISNAAHQLQNHLNLKKYSQLVRTPPIGKRRKKNSGNVTQPKTKVTKSFKKYVNDLETVHKILVTPKSHKSPKNDLSDLKGVKNLYATPKAKKSLENDFRGLKKLLMTPESCKRSMKNLPKSFQDELNKVKGVQTLTLSPRPTRIVSSDFSKGKKLKATPKLKVEVEHELESQERLANAVSDVKGVKKLSPTPKYQKSPKNDLSNTKSGKKELLGTPKSKNRPKQNLNDLIGVKKSLTAPRVQRNPKNELKDLRGVKKLLATPRVQKSPRNELKDLRGVKKLLATPRVQKSPRNELKDLRGVKKLLATPRVQKSPRNELKDLRGVKKLLATPRVQKSPKNELNDLRGVKKLLATPRVQRSPKNELNDLRGVKKLLATPRVQRSPKNELNDLRGVKKLLATPRVQRSPKNELKDLRGVKKLLATPRVQRSPKNELNDLRGIKKLLATPRVQRSPKNELIDLRGIKKLLATPRVQRSPKNELNDLRGVKKLLATPRVQRSPKNELNDLRGVKKLLATPRVQKSPKNDLSDLEGVKELLITPKAQNISVAECLGNSIRGADDSQELQSLQPYEGFQDEIKNTAGVQVRNKQESFKSLGYKRNSQSKGITNEKLLVKSSADKENDQLINSSINLRRRRTMSSAVKTKTEERHNIKSVEGKRKSYVKKKPLNNLNISLTGVTQSFDLSMEELLKPAVESKMTRSRTKKMNMLTNTYRNSAEINSIKRCLLQTADDELERRAPKKEKKNNMGVKLTPKQEEKETSKKYTKGRFKEEEFTEVEKNSSLLIETKATEKKRKRTEYDDLNVEKNIINERLRSRVDTEVPVSSPKLRKIESRIKKTASTALVISPKARVRRKTEIAESKVETIKKKEVKVGRKKSTKSQSTNERIGLTPSKVKFKSPRRKVGESLNKVTETGTSGSIDGSRRITRRTANKMEK